MPLDKFQQKVVDYEIPLNSAVRVVANAGAGKSTTMLHKARHLVRVQKQAPGSIVMVTFSRKSREDLEKKWERTFPKSSPPIISTLHSFGLRILRKHFKEKFGLIKPYEQQRLVRFFLEQGGYKIKDIKFEIFAVLNEISYYKSMNIDLCNSKFTKPDMSFPREIKMSISFKEFLALYRAYEAHKEHEKLYDFDDLIFKTYRKLADNPDVLAKVKAKYSNYIVDESQDLNKLNWDFVFQLSANLRLIAVGDLCQNIYLFRYAQPDMFSLDTFEAYFESTKNFKLPYNYRSVQEIVDLGNQIRKLRNDELIAKPTKKLSGHGVRFYMEKSANAEGKLAIKLVKLLVEKGYKLSDITIICRSSKFLKTVVEKTVIEANLNYQILAGNSMSFHDSNSVVLFMGMISLLVNPNNMLAWTSIVPFMHGMGEFKRLKSGIEAVGKNAKAYTDLILKLKKPKVTTKNANMDAQLAAFYEDICAYRGKMNAQAPFYEILDGLFAMHTKYVKQDYVVKKQQYDRLRATLMNFVNDFKELNKAKKLRDALYDMLLNVTEYDPDDTKDALTLSTVHAQKGLESKVTIACGFRSYGQLDDLGDEINILYVQMSRAIEKLIVIRSEKVRGMKGNIVAGAENPHLMSLVDVREGKVSETEPTTPPW